MSANYRPRRQHGPRPSSAARDSAARDTAVVNPAAAKRDAARRANQPRRTAYDVLAAVRTREAYANLLLPRLLAERQLTGRDAALATELTYGTLRGQGTYDAVLSACSDRPLAKLDPPVLDVLRLGAHQLLSTRVGAHAAVATSVDLAKSVIGPRVSGYVNAVLRRVATRDLAAWLPIVAPDPATDPDGYLAIRYSHPRWIVAAYRAALADRADAPFISTPDTSTLIPEPLTGQPEPGTDNPEPGTDNPEPGTDTMASTSILGLATGSPATESPATESPATAAPIPKRPLGSSAPGPGAADPTGAAASSALASTATMTELEAALAAGNARPRVTLATFPAGPPREDVMPPDAAPGRWSPYAFTLASGDPTPLVETGTAAVQDEGSQLAALALTRVPLDPAGSPGHPERWLDMCAGPGGKARLLYGLATLAPEAPPALQSTVIGDTAADSGTARTSAADTAITNTPAPVDSNRTPRALLTAAELHPHRAALVREALTTASRTIKGEPPAFEVIVADATNPPWPAEAFDRILLDVPCSGLGALRRRPEARWRKSKSDLKALTALQRALLRSALSAVRPGGIVAYVTCSPLPAETTDVVTEVAASTPGITILNAPDYLPNVPDTPASAPQFAQLWPHRQGTDAIFVALLRRTAG